MHLTGFDIFAGAIVLISALLGLLRGGTREVVTLSAFVAGAAAAIVGARFAAPVVRRFIHTPWLAHVVAFVALFLIVYVIVRLIGGRLIQGVRETSLSGPDRLFGAAIGVARGAVVVGLVVILIEAATPVERMPGWFTHAKLYPVANVAGHTLRVLAPKGVQLARNLAPTVEGALDGDSDDEANPPERRSLRTARRAGYSNEQRSALDDLVEKSR
ncbi:MAG TPA: CvpA family protein [Caulobacteraceae bacterium]|jgi:membrane protein required for colicin V production|nr:CvpA family protein [Caulobacteraceae bacterium]